ncbi:DUF6191 domain-containing protein [Streptomyces sp. NPDC002012]|uniref:DUF6191 domain-containing protein n=1 Tax=unclassified Streptomyces TaxID=2593676 RepID=UPI003333FC9C
MFNFFEELFAPGRKHAAEEQKRLELTRVDLGVGDPGRGPIDLASGKVIVRASGTDGGPAAERGATDAIPDPDQATDHPDEASGPDTDTPDAPEAGPDARP